MRKIWQKMIKKINKIKGELMIKISGERHPLEKGREKVIEYYRH